MTKGGFGNNIIPNSPESGVGQIFSPGAGTGAARFPLSESTSGEPILATNNTGASATKIHQCSTNALDEVYLWAANYSSDDIVLTMSYNDTGFSTNGKYFTTTLGGDGGLYLVLPGMPVTGGTKVYAKATTNKVVLQGFILRRYSKRGGSGKGKVKDSGYDGQN